MNYTTKYGGDNVLYTCVKDYCSENGDKCFNFIENVEAFCEDILLGCQEAVTVLVADKESGNAKMLESVGCEVVTLVDISCTGDIIEDSTTITSDMESSTIVEDTVDELNNISIEVETINDDPSYSDKFIDSITTEIEFEDTLTTNDIDIVEETTNIVSNSNQETISKKGKPSYKSFLSKLPFLRKKSSNVVEIQIDNSFAKSINNMSVDLNNINTFKRWLLTEQYLNNRELKTIELEVSARKGRGLNPKFLSVARELGMLTDSQCSKILTSAYKREIKCFEQIDISNSKRLTKHNSFLRKDCFLISQDTDERVIVVGHDIDNICDLGEVEVYFPGYKIICKEFVEGTTNKVVCDITA